MPKLFYQLADADTLSVYADPAVEEQADLQAALPPLQEIQGLSDATRALIAASGIPSLQIPGQPDLASFDAALDDEIDRIRDVLDYFSYDTGQETFGNVAQGAWYTPDAIESVSHENVGEEATLAIDDDFSTWWQSDDGSSTREIIFKLRDYPKKIERIRVRAPVTDLRAQIQGVTIKASKALAMIDDPDNTLDAGVNFTYIDNIWLEHTLAAVKANARYIKLEITQSLFVADPAQVRIREIEVRVGTRFHNK